MKKLTALSYLAIFLLVGYSCKKEDKNVEKSLVVEVDNTVVGSPTIVQSTKPAPPAYTPDQAAYFDWEHASTMPGVSYAEKIPVPWSDDADRQYLDALRYDYKKSDGWELLFNSYRSDLNFSNRRFVLYNKYRGVVRSYIYNELPPNQNFNLPTTFLHDLTFRFGSSMILNFAANNVVNMASPATNAVVDDPFPLKKNAWYISEFELAYDKDLSKTSYRDLGLTAGVRYTTPYNGIVAGKNADLSKLSFLDLTRGVRQIAPMLEFQLQAEKQLIDYQNILSPKTFVSLQRQISLKEENTKMFNALIIPELGLAKLKLELEGSISNPSLTFLMDDFGLPLSGQKIDSFIASPNFTEIPGIFYLDKEPEIKVQKNTSSGQVQYSLNTPSVIYRFNPEIYAYVDIQSISQEIVATPQEDGKSLTEAKVYHGQSIRASDNLNIVGVRVSFNIVPKNGSKKIQMIKTFRATFIE